MSIFNTKKNSLGFLKKPKDTKVVVAMSGWRGFINSCGIDEKRRL